MAQPPESDPPAAAEQAEPEQATTKGDGGISAAGMVVAAIGGGIGVLSFVAFFGAAILWVRMDEAGLPGNEAVAVVPRSVLLSTGANFLVPSLLAALAFVALLYLIETITVMWRTRKLRGLEIELAVREAVAEARQEEATEAGRKSSEAAELVVTMQEATKKAEESPALDEGVARDAERVAQTAVENATEVRREALPEAHKAHRDLKAIKRQVERERHIAQAGVEARRRALRGLLTIALFALGALATFIWFSIGIDPGRLFVLLVLLVTLCTVCLAILFRTDSFSWFALAVVAAVGILSGFLTYYRTVDHTKVEPAAVLRTNGAPIYGFFVAQTSDRVYIGTEIAGGAISLAAIPRDEVTELAVGSLQPVEDVRALARELAIHVCLLSRQRSPGDGAVASRAGPAGAALVEECTAADLSRLSS